MVACLGPRRDVMLEVTSSTGAQYEAGACLALLSDELGRMSSLLDWNFPSSFWQADMREFVGAELESQGFQISWVRIIKVGL